MIYHGHCPYCGINMYILLTKSESLKYDNDGQLPVDINERLVCPNCVDDGVLRNSKDDD